MRARLVVPRSILRSSHPGPFETCAGQVANVSRAWQLRGLQKEANEPALRGAVMQALLPGAGCRALSHALSQIPRMCARVKYKLGGVHGYELAYHGNVRTRVLEYVHTCHALAWMSAVRCERVHVCRKKSAM